MKARLIAFATLLSALALFFFPTDSFAGIKYLKITVKSAKVWPVKPSGKCWDPCLGKKFQLPARGAKDYTKYFEDQNFRKACTGTWAPDPLVEIQIGQYEKFTTDKINNTCTPEWNVGHTFRVAEGAPFTVSVYDNDGAAGYQAKRDLMGTYTAPSVPAELMNGGTLSLKSFGQVEELILEAKVVEKPALSASCDGVYKIRIVEFDVKDKKENGKSWDPGFGKMKLPDVIVSLKIGNDTIESPKQQDTTSFKFTDDVSKTIPIKKGLAVTLEVYDKDIRSKETIGQTAESDVCTLISKSQNGVYTFENFGQVNKVVIIFEKQK